MNIQCNGDLTINGGSVTTTGLTVMCDSNHVFINGEEIPIPRGMKTNNISTVNNKVFIGGFEFFEKDKRFKRTLEAFIHSVT